MRKAIFALLLLAGGATRMLAQEIPNWRTKFIQHGKAEATFNMAEGAIHHRHRASLGNGNQLTIELRQYDDYRLLPDIERLMKTVRTDIAFLKDSFEANPQSSYRIDYLMDNGGMKAYRIHRYEPQDEFLYQKSGAQVTPYKPEPDTLRVLLVNPENGIKDCQLTFVLQRMANLDNLLADEGRLNNIIDTFKKATAPHLRSEKKHPYLYESSVFISKNRKDTTKLRIDFSRTLRKEQWDVLNHRSSFDVSYNIGAGFLRDKVAPAAEIGLIYRLPSTKSKDVSSVLGVYISGYFGFEKGSDGQFRALPNYWINAELGDEGFNHFTPYIITSRLTVGVGYLLSGSGDYYKKTTLKAFMNITLKNGITLSPEVIATDNLRQVFPGLTLKVF